MEILRLVRGRLALLVVVLATLVGPTAAAQELTGLARLDAGASRIAGSGWSGVSVELRLSQPVPWRVRVMDGPPRLVMDFREVEFGPVEALAKTTDRVREVRAGAFRPGWSRLVMELEGPMVVETAGMRTGEGARIAVTLRKADAAEFAARAGAAEPSGWALPPAADLPRRAQGSGPLTVVLDPGHGGIDPGAERGGISEASLMLTLARELKEALLRDGTFRVAMTREEDVFVPLEARITRARAAGGQVFVSLHADAIAEGEAVGATLYTLAEEASDAAAAALAERHDRDDLLAGIDLTGHDDLVAGVLMDLARTETGPRNERLALALEAAIKGQGLAMHRHPRQAASFSVLKSPDMPSILVETGFMSSDADLARLRDPAWRARMIAALVDGLKGWAREDAALKEMLRR
ncbi:N-acetylmuramoyl-L-alanine amidase [Cereibacter azotoformans]|uniref:N-acetylmuramoyl-L-alanine amidase n=1 Tax=Cereibacter sphaeroides (strain ATCC 17025 / ATH 2.4.3) TaxID=349102 RepID=A4WTN5_CERS5|nr:N-acetylmuramoyl-L-alanine amidase [Cereibacter azotoformans]ULB09995.1 N-acetylmuramoyl-L-alanine amidase [Cereibacter azotoformans]